MTLAEIQNDTLQYEAIQAADSRFFNASESDTSHLDALRLSNTFWLNNMDLLKENRGIFLQTGLDEAGNMVDLADGIHSSVLTAAFDGSGHFDSEFVWEFTEARRNSGRDTLTLKVTGASMQGEIKSYDTQGRLRCIAENGSNCEETLAFIRWVVGHQKTAEHARELREVRTKAEESLGTFVMENFSKLGKGKYEKDVAARERQINNVGFGNMA